MNDSTSVHLKQIQPLGHSPNASVQVPGSKSLTNRALMIAALAESTTTLTNALFSDDSRYFAQALQSLGFAVSLDEEKTQMTIRGLGGTIPNKSAELFIGNAGTAARFLTAFLTLGNGQFILDGNDRMRERPIGHLVDALNRLGAQITPINLTQSPVCPPLQITASGLTGGATQIAGNISSQFLSALLMAAPYAREPVVIETSTELNSKPYVEMTLEVMATFGVDVIRYGYERFEISPGLYKNRPEFSIESDASAASYFFAVPAICGGTVRVENISRKSTQGDIRFLDVLSNMGCSIIENQNSIGVTSPGELIGIDLDMNDIPDTAQTLAAIAPFASSPTRIRGIASARLKETDRISATCSELRKIGVRVEEYEDGMTIYPCTEFIPGIIHTYNDHRMAMAFSLIGLRVPGIGIEDPGCVSKTFPKFFDVLDSLK